MTLREAALELADSCEEARNYLLQHEQSGYPVAAINIVRAAYDANQPEPPVTPSMWRAVQRLKGTQVARRAARGCSCDACAHIRSVLAALDGTPEPVATDGSDNDERVAQAKAVTFAVAYLTPSNGNLELSRALNAFVPSDYAVLKRLAGRA